MPNHVENTPLSNYTLTKIIRTGLSPLSAMIGTSTYYGQLIGNPILGCINALLFSKKLFIDIWHLNQTLDTKSRLLNSSKKILLGLGTIGLVNYSKFTNTISTTIEPSSTTLLPSTTTLLPIITTSSTTTNIDPWPPILSASNNSINNNQLMDWSTYTSLNAYGITNLIGGLTELIPNRFKTIRKITNMATGACLISSGVAMGINNDFSNAYALPTIIAGISEIIHNLLPMETTHTTNTEMQETTFTNETAILINACCDDSNSMGSMDSLSLNSDSIIEDRSNPYQPTTMRL